MQNSERRVATLELRAADGDEFVIEGHASVFGNEYDCGDFQERTMHGCFADAIRSKQDTKCLLNHDSNIVLGRVGNGTLTLRETATGLHYRCQLDPSNLQHRSIHASIKRGDIFQSSFGFTCENDDCDEWENVRRADGTSYIRRTIRKVTKLMDCSPVCYPANERATVSARDQEVPVEVRSKAESLKGGITLCSWEGWEYRDGDEYDTLDEGEAFRENIRTLLL